MKKSLLLVLGVLFLISQKEIVYATDNIDPSFGYENKAHGSCGENAYWALSDDGELVIYGTGDMTSGEEYAEHFESVKSIEIKDGITSICDDAFFGMEFAENDLYIPATVESIGDYAFYGCEKLTGDLIIPDSVQTIGRAAFGYCLELNGTLKLPKDITYIEESAFEYCTGLTGNLVIPDGVTEIKPYAFWGCRSMDGTLSIPDSVTMIGQGAFGQCNSFKGNLTIPDNVTEIGSVAFYDCYSLDGKLTLPRDITIIKDSTFENCFKLAGNVIIPSAVTKIEDDAFRMCEEIENLIILNPECQIEAIGSDVFDTIASNVSILAPENSKAHLYAAENGYTYEKCYRFTDIKEKDYYREAVMWAADQDITTGETELTFAPNDSCTRAQVVTFLWRAMGSPIVENVLNPFEDIKPTDYYYNAVLWAVKEGITTGTTHTKFAPDDTCTRCQVATFLWRTEQSPQPKTQNNPFKDLVESEYYFDAVLWAAENSITTGATADTFAPEEECTRGQIVTFLYRIYQ